MAQPIRSWSSCTNWQQSRSWKWEAGTGRNRGPGAEPAGICDLRDAGATNAAPRDDRPSFSAPLLHPLRGLRFSMFSVLRCFRRACEKGILQTRRARRNGGRGEERDAEEEKNRRRQQQNAPEIRSDRRGAECLEMFFDRPSPDSRRDQDEIAREPRAISDDSGQNP